MSKSLIRRYNQKLLEYAKKLVISLIIKSLIKLQRFHHGIIHKQKKNHWKYQKLSIYLQKKIQPIIDDLRLI